MARYSDGRRSRAILAEYETSSDDDDDDDDDDESIRTRDSAADSVMDVALCCSPSVVRESEQTVTPGTITQVPI